MISIIERHTMKLTKFLLSSLLAVSSLVAGAADLTFDLKIDRGAPKVDSVQLVKKDTIAVFVIDCSGSMLGDYEDKDGNKYYGPAGRKSKKPWSRVDWVCWNLLPERFKALPSKTQVYVYLYSLANVKKYFKMIPKVLDSDATKELFLQDLRKQIMSSDFFWKNENGRLVGGATPYYDTMAAVLSAVENNSWLCGSINLELYDYTDGANNTLNYKNFKYKTNGENNSTELEAAKKNFTRDYGAVLDKIAKEGFYEPLNVGTKKENPGVKQIPAYRVSFSSGKSVLADPLKNPSQSVPLNVFFRVNEESWALLQKEKCTVAVQVGSGPAKEQVFDLRGGQCKITISDDVLKNSEKEIPVIVSLKCTNGNTDKFTLVSPAPVKIYLPAPDRKPTIDNVFVSSTIVRKDKPVFFTAEGGAESFVWEFSDGNRQEDRSVTRTFGKIGTVEYTVYPKGNPDSKKTGTIKVVDLGISIEQQSKTTPVGQPVTISAKVKPNCEAPSSCSWYVVGPIGGKEDPDVDPMDGLLKGQYTFRVPGKYKIKVMAKYEKLPLETVEEERIWYVSQPAEIAFNFDKMKGAESGFEFNAPVTLAIREVSGKIDPKSIVWKANGKKIGSQMECSYKNSDQTVKEITFTVEAEDAADKGRKLKQEIRYTFGCSHDAKPQVKVLKDNTELDVLRCHLYEKLDLVVDGKSEYKEIVWVFGDDQKQVSPEEGSKSVSYSADKAGKFTLVMTCKCAKCDQTFEPIEKTIEITSQEPKPRLVLKPEKTSYSNGDSVTLCDEGTGDYFRCRLLRLDPKTGEFVDFDKDQKLEYNFKDVHVNLGEAPFLVPGLSQRADFAFKIQALDKDGNPILKEDGTPVESALRTIRVRNHLLSAGILVVGFFVVGFVFYILSKFLLGNGPRAWVLRYKVVGEKPSQKSLRELYLDVQKNGNSKKLLKYWKAGYRTASIKLASLLGCSGYPDDMIVIDPEKNPKRPMYCRIPEMIGTLPSQNPREYCPIFKIRPIGSKDPNDERNKYLLTILDQSKSAHGSEVMYYVLLILVLLGLLAAGLWMFMA